MVGQTVTRAHLGEAVYQEVGLSRNESMDLLEMVIDFMGDALVKGIGSSKVEYKCVRCFGS